MIQTERTHDVLKIQLAHGKASALDLELLQAIVREIEAFEASDAKACVVTGSGGIFSAGVDLKRWVDDGVEYLDAFLPALDEAFQRLFFCSKPIVVACNGHAIAGGCILLACGDVRIGATGKGQIGVPELAVGVPFPLLALEIMRFASAPQSLQTLLYSGRTFPMEDGLRMGQFDRLVAPEELDGAALQAAKQLGSYPAAAFADTKRLLREPVAARLRESGPAHAARARELWGSPAVSDAVRAYVEKTLR